MTKIVNCTPHELRIQQVNGRVIVVPISRYVARVDMVETHDVFRIGKIGITTVAFGEVIGLPEPQENTIYVVSSIVRQRLEDRPDVFGVGEIVRNAKGHPLYCKGLKSI